MVWHELSFYQTLHGRPKRTACIPSLTIKDEKHIVHGNETVDEDADEDEDEVPGLFTHLPPHGIHVCMVRVKKMGGLIFF